MTSTIKSYSVGNGDMFYINHGSDNFTIIDCHLNDDRSTEILDEVAPLCACKGITRFISTHPDEDHIQGLVELDDRIGILNFYCVENHTIKEDESESFKRYKNLRDSSKASYLFKGCSRYWMNKTKEGRGSSGINILWPDRANEHFKDALRDAGNGNSPNNISPILKYSLTGGVTALWMGDLETPFMEAIEDAIQLPKVDVLFAPHHGRKSGRVPRKMLKDLSPRVIVIGEAPSEDLTYYQDYKTITQNSAGDILFENHAGKVRIFTTSRDYRVDFLHDEGFPSLDGYYYLGTLYLS